MSNPYDNRVAKNASVIGPSLKFKGELSANEDLLIQGEIEGSINHTSNLTIGQEGKVKANVTAEVIAVEGKVDGDLVGSKSVVVKENANVEGNIYSPTVTLREGSKFNGKVDMTGKQRPQSKEPEVARQSKELSTTESHSKDDEKTESSEKKAGSNRKRSANAA